MDSLRFFFVILSLIAGTFANGVPQDTKNDWVTVWSKNLWYVGASHELFAISTKQVLFFKNVYAEGLTALDFQSLDKKPLLVGLGVRLNTLSTDTGVDFSIRAGGGFTQEENFSVRRFQWYVGIGVRW